tara:strand:+ start:160 stop:582 length:423 start_codon:yes stop_codon:yes gene_type:complete
MLKISIDQKPKGKFIFIEIEKNFIPFTINKISSNKFLKLEEISNEKEAKKLQKKHIYEKLEKWEKEEKKEINIIDFKIIDKNYKYIGKIKKIIQRKIQPLILAEFKNKEFYIPFHEKFITKINHNKKTIETNIPEGIINF